MCVEIIVINMLLKKRIAIFTTYNYSLFNGNYFSRCSQQIELLSVIVAAVETLYFVDEDNRES